jgi:hypothetical protein
MSNNQNNAYLQKMNKIKSSIIGNIQPSKTNVYIPSTNNRQIILNYNTSFGHNRQKLNKISSIGNIRSMPTSVNSIERGPIQMQAFYNNSSKGTRALIEKNIKDRQNEQNNRRKNEQNNTQNIGEPENIRKTIYGNENNTEQVNTTNIAKNNNTKKTNAKNNNLKKGISIKSLIPSKILSTIKTYKNSWFKKPISFSTKRSPTYNPINNPINGSKHRYTLGGYIRTKQSKHRIKNYKTKKRIV